MLPLFGERDSPRGDLVRPQMVTLARESRGFSQKEFAGFLNVTPGEISRIEAGLRRPTPHLVESMAQVLEYPPSFFAQDVQLYGAGMGELFHRRLRDVPTGVLARAHAITNLRRQEVEALLRSAEIPECRITHVDIEQYDGPSEDIARRVRAAWNLPAGPIDNLSQTIEDAGGIIVRCDFLTDKIAAISQWIPPLPPLFYVNETLPQDRLRLSLAHELGHVIMHQVAHSNIDPAANPEAEQQAFTFGAELLMPERDIRADFMERVTLPRLAVLKGYWKVSMHALVMRAKEVRAITPRHAKTLFAQLAVYRHREPPELDVRSESPGLVQELIDAHTHGMGYSVDELAALLHRLPSETRRLYFPEARRRLRVVG
jgi:Zn-dependent peptidase ImmA (M78 family)/DNA-binding XRE family transcriptional regulator